MTSHVSLVGISVCPGVPRWLLMLQNRMLWCGGLFHNGCSNSIVQVGVAGTASILVTVWTGLTVATGDCHLWASSRRETVRSGV